MAKLGERGEKMEQTSFYLPFDLKEEIEEFCDLTGENQSEIIRIALREYLSKKRKKVEKINLLEDKIVE